MKKARLWILLKVFYRHLRGNRAMVGAVLLLGGLSSAVALLVPLVSKRFIDAVAQQHDYRLLPRLVALLFVLALADLVLGTARRMAHLKLSTRILNDMRNRLFSRCLTLPLEALERHRHGDLMNRFGSDLPKVQVLLVDGVIGFIHNLIFLAVAAVVLFHLSMTLALVSLAGLAVSLLVSAAFRRPVEEGTRIVREAMVEISHFLAERLGFLRSIRLHAAQEEERVLFGRLNDAFAARLLRYQWIDSAASGVSAVVLSVNLACIYLAGGKLLEWGVITLGTFVAFMLYQGRLSAPALGLLGLVRSMQETRVSLERLCELLCVESAPWKPHPGGKAAVVFYRVTFGYPQRRTILRDTSFDLAGGEKVALFGASGTGKSTIVQLLFGLRRPERGEIFLGKRDAGPDVAALPRLGYAGSEPFLIHASVADNIRYGNPQAGYEEVIEAARAAEAHEFICNLSGGYQAVVGGRGCALSDGQRQRIGLARLFLTRAPVMVLDEAFSCLDPELEGRIRRTMLERFRGSTVLFISHRLHALSDFDRLLLLEEGTVFQVGERDLMEALGGRARPPLPLGEGVGPRREQLPSPQPSPIGRGRASERSDQVYANAGM